MSRSRVRPSWPTRFIDWNWHDPHGFQLNLAFVAGVFGALVSSHPTLAGLPGILLAINVLILPSFRNVAPGEQRQVWLNLGFAFVTAICLFAIWGWTRWWAGILALIAIIASELRPRD